MGKVAIDFAKKFDIKIPQLGPVPSFAGDVPVGRGFAVEMPNERGGNPLNMDAGNGPGNNPPSGNSPDSNTPGGGTSDGKPAWRPSAGGRAARQGDRPRAST
ncbi:hypothetical protein ACLQ28_14735 [Micromonospora sp. DT201]|uniref:hypothetical protein n=1 Tax=Micromonospora sp. DT201 TaxID=3393442 RepID=UPI003CFA1AEE